MPSTPQILSNVVACKLHLNESAGALDDAKACVAADPRWAKGHLRLAEVYSALGKSNDACNECQRAINLDPGNANAKRIMMRELRKRDGGGGQADGISSPTQSNPSNSQPANPTTNQPDISGIHDNDSSGTPSFVSFLLETKERFSEYFWALDSQSRLWVGLTILFSAAIISFAVYNSISSLLLGGEVRGVGATTTTRGNYDGDSIYDQYRRERGMGNTAPPQSSSSYSPPSSSSSSSAGAGGGPSYDYYEAQRRQRAAKKGFWDQSSSGGFFGMDMKTWVAIITSLIVGTW